MKTRYSMREFIEEILEDDTSDFSLWAFGLDFENLNCLGCMKKWNEKHSDKLELSDSGHVAEDIVKMIRIWKDETDQ